MLLALVKLVLLTLVPGMRDRGLPWAPALPREGPPLCHREGPLVTRPSTPWEGDVEREEKLCGGPSEDQGRGPWGRRREANSPPICWIEGPDPAHRRPLLPPSGPHAPGSQPSIGRPCPCPAVDAQALPTMKVQQGDSIQGKQGGCSRQKSGFFFHANHSVHHSRTSLGFMTFSTKPLCSRQWLSRQTSERPALSVKMQTAGPCPQSF